eukprot:gnl/Trimastix_PCT/2230.p1 GENE.gnl/Trimastix_PCT/2230~~gnl/Trimastix_PCT/2230.p1  ORF type:complete len:382 (+),score=130.09 gnl/Trimastix_PCT/2230:55-1200(+)
MGCSWSWFNRKFCVPIFLITGTIAVIFSKAVYKVEAMGWHDVHRFEKPWFTDWAMFVGMAMCFPVYWGQSCANRRKKALQELDDPDKVDEPKTSFTKLFWVVAIPGLCDLISTFLMNVGLLWIPASIWQMLRGSIVIFTAILTITYRRRKLSSAQWLGVLIVFIALAIVGTAAIAGGSKKNTTVVKTIIGIVLVIFAQFLQALQTIIEEKLLHDVNASSTLIVALEGFWGFFICSAIVFPIVYFLPGKSGDGIHEDTLDSFIMIGNNPVLLVFIILYTLSILFFNIYGMIITEYTQAVTRNILESLRTLFIWVCNIFIHYVITKTLGEALTYWSILQAGGFAVLSFGLLVYNHIIKLPCLNYKDPNAAPEDSALIKDDDSQ